MPIAAAVPAIIGAAGAIGGAMIASHGASAAANDQMQGQLASIDEQRRQYNVSRGDELPYMHAGQGALAQLGQLNRGNYSSFHASPDYKFTLDQGLQGIDRSAAARGSLESGGHTTDVINYAEGAASRQYDDYYNKIAGLANLGQDATARTGALGAGAADQISNGFGNIGNAQAQGAIGSANAWSGALNGLGNSLGQLSQSSFGGGGLGGYSTGFGQSSGAGRGYSFGGNFTPGYGSAGGY